MGLLQARPDPGAPRNSLSLGVWVSLPVRPSPRGGTSSQELHDAPGRSRPASGSRCLSSCTTGASVLCLFHFFTYMLHSASPAPAPAAPAPTAQDGGRAQLRLIQNAININRG